MKVTPPRALFMSLAIHLAAGCVPAPAGPATVSAPPVATAPRPVAVTAAPKQIQLEPPDLVDPSPPATRPSPAAAPKVTPAPVVDPRGPVMAVGGGQVPIAAYKRMLALAKGKTAAVLVFPQASKKANGEIDIKEWRAAGASNVTAALKLTKRRDQVLAAIGKADILWFGGGAQLRLMKALTDARLVDAIRARHKAGAVVGGTSAGAAVLSATMLSGRPKPGALRHGMTTYTGLGLWPGAIVDQHFVARKRFGRLLTAVLKQPDLVGIGVGEYTAVLFDFQTRSLEVLGDGVVVIYDARLASMGASKAAAATSGRQSATDIRMHLQTGGQRWSFVPATTKAR